MKYAQKMVLVSEAEYRMLQEMKNKRPKESELKTKMKKVLAGERDYDAAKKMAQLLGESIRYKQKSFKPEKKRTDLEQYFPPTYHSKVTLLLKELKDHGIDYSGQNELMLPGGQVVPNSNIVDLLKEALLAKKKTEPPPVGWPEFIRSIASTNIPLSTFTKRTTKKQIEEARDGGQAWEVY